MVTCQFLRAQCKDRRYYKLPERKKKKKQESKLHSKYQIKSASDFLGAILEGI